MANTILVGAQWGDEGKGKIIDVLTESADIVVRYAGGNNAGHTVWLGKKKYVLHLVPSGILRPKKLCVIGNGVVVDPIGLVEEIEGLKKIGVKVTPKNFVLSETAHVVFPYHRELDAQREVMKGKNKIGTTKRGIGPAYGDKAARVGLRVGDLVDPARLETKLSARIKENNVVLKSLGAKQLSFKQVFAEYNQAGQYLKPFVTNTVVLLHDAMRGQADILFEGAQGTFLDIDHGTYPFVTSSNTTAGGACTGSGVPPHRMDRVVGVMKAYTTRVGEGPLPTENAEISDLLHGMGREFGATTGRARRAGGLIPSPRATRRWSTALTISPSPISTVSTRWKTSRSASRIATARRNTTICRTTRKFSRSACRSTSSLKAGSRRRTSARRSSSSRKRRRRI